MSTNDILTKLNASFGSYRAEWLKSKVFELFAEPSYFPALQDSRPCVLEGGRGTGKTTVLRGLSYHGQYAIHRNNISLFDESPFIGIYHRVNTNHVRAFCGDALEDREWESVFGHYFNLLICREILVYIRWHKSLKDDDEELSPHACRLIAKAINVTSERDDIDSLFEAFDLAMYSFQSGINNIADRTLPKLSMTGDPIRLITEHALSLTQFRHKVFFILLDEYENYTDYQQKIINTLLKHNTEHYTFKIGVRELGWRVKHTLNSMENLVDPADYVMFNIENKLTEGDSSFSDFAKDVCEQRIKKILAEDQNTAIYEIEIALPGLSIEEESELLEVQKTQHYRNFEKLPGNVREKFIKTSSHFRFFIAYWASIRNMDLIDAAAEYINFPAKVKTRYDNYKYETLFKIRRGRGMSGIQKYYSGWTTYTKLANGNIRYLMELVYRAYEKHLSVGLNLDSPVSHKDQTEAAQEAGRKNLMELEGVWKNGAQLTKLLLGLGRVFQLLASGDSRSAPEQNQFSIERTNKLDDEFEELIRFAVMNLALIRTPGNKLSENHQTRDYLYMIHPLYSAFFQFSHRKKRRISLRPTEILAIIQNPREGIIKILGKANITNDTFEPLPQQMSLFESYYNEG